MQILRSLVFMIFISVTLSEQTFQFGDACEGEDCDNNPSEEKLNIPLNTFDILNQLDSETKKNKNSDIVTFTGLTDASKLSKHCCQNGGTCFLGTFCICPKHFTGRHCEYDTRIRSCGTIPHGEWNQEECQLCRCIYGIVNCLHQPQRPGCDPTKEKMLHWVHP